MSSDGSLIGSSVIVGSSWRKVSKHCSSWGQKVIILKKKKKERNKEKKRKREREKKFNHPPLSCSVQKLNARHIKTY
jgi:hypothetical protein